MLDLTLVKNEVDGQIDQGKMFTAYDITKKLRDAKVWCKHNEVRDEVHNLFHNDEMGADYRRTNGLVNSRNDYAWIYHHYMDDAADYVNPSVSPANVLSPVKTVVVPASIPHSAPTFNTNFYQKSVDSRGRLLIEKKYVSDVGFEPGDDAYVYFNTAQACLVIVDGTYAGTLLKVYVVDKDGAIRIGKNVLNHIGTSSTKTIKSTQYGIFVE